MTNTELDVIEQANAAAQRIEEANKVMAELVKQQNAIDARRVLGGQSEAGQVDPQVSIEEKNKADTKNYFKGTALESVL